MTRLMHYTGWIRAFEFVVIPENDVLLSRFLEATNKKQALIRPKERMNRVDRVDRVIWNCRGVRSEVECWEGGDKLLMRMNGLSLEDGKESVECSEDGEVDSGNASVRSKKRA